MKGKLQINLNWLRKAAFCLAFIGLFIARQAEAYGLPPLISVPPVGLSVQKGGTVTLTATVAASLTPLTVKWRFNGEDLENVQVTTLTVPILGTTITTLTISNVSAADAGKYSVRAENNGGSITSGNAVVVVLDLSGVLSTVSLLTSQCGLTNGGFRLNLLKPATSNCVIEASTDIMNWTPIYTNTSGSTNISYIDPAATNMVYRYYRARPPINLNVGISGVQQRRGSELRALLSSNLLPSRS